jgi:hypothetical protein
VAEIVLALLGLWAVTAIAPATPAAVAIRHWLVVRPAEWLRRIGRGHVALLVIVAILIPATAWLAGRDSVPLAGMALPALASWAATFEVTTLIDLMIAGLAAGASLRFGRLSFMGHRWRRNARPEPDHAEAQRCEDCGSH